MTDITTITPENNQPVSNELLQHIKQCFTTDEQQLFVDSFVTYLHHKKDEFVVNFNVAVEWLQFSNKGNAKKLLTSKFTENVHYKIIFIHTDKKSKGRTKQQILLTVPSFKKFCLVANTSKSDVVHDYYINLEECLHQFLQHQLEHKDEQLQSYIRQANEHKLLLDSALEQPYQPVLREQTLYVAQHESEKHTDLFKLGETLDWNKRHKQHNTSSSQGINLVFSYQTHNSKLLETLVKHCLYAYKFGNEKPSKKGGNEWYKCPLPHIKRVVCLLGPFVDTVTGFRATISDQDSLKLCFKHVLLSFVDTDSQLTDVVPDLICDSYQHAFDSASKRLRRKVHRLISEPTQAASVEQTILNNVHDKLDRSMEDLLKELGF